MVKSVRMLLLFRTDYNSDYLKLNLSMQLLFKNNGNFDVKRRNLKIFDGLIVLLKKCWNRRYKFWRTECNACRVNTRPIECKKKKKTMNFFFPEEAKTLRVECLHRAGRGSLFELLRHDRQSFHWLSHVLLERGSCYFNREFADCRSVSALPSSQGEKTFRPRAREAEVRPARRTSSPCISRFSKTHKYLWQFAKKFYLKRFLHKNILFIK